MGWFLQFHPNPTTPPSQSSVSHESESPVLARRRSDDDINENDEDIINDDIENDSGITKANDDDDIVNDINEATNKSNCI